MLRSTGGRAGAAVLAGGLAGYWLPGLAWACPPLCSALGIVRRLEDADGVLLTFDDGPHPQGTPAILDRLAEAGASAVFFLVGEQVERYPDLAATIAAVGHEVALHCHRHRPLPALTPGQLADDLRRATTAISAATGRAPRLYRPPYGVFSAAGLVHARRSRWTPLHWSREGRDWRAGAGAASIAARATARLRGGDILLLHDADHYSAPGSWRVTAAALPRILEEIESCGLEPRRPGDVAWSGQDVCVERREELAWARRR